jgi:hypothetical protein
MLARFALLVTVSAAPLAQAHQETPPLGCDRTAIEWFLPGDFSSALEKAKESRRILVIKGISFGVDEAGATCATKGVW